MSLKALARAVLERNHQGNLEEISWRNQGNIGGANQAKKFPVEFNYVACTKCANLEDGYCKAWGHSPDVPEYEIRLCNKYEDK